MTAAFQRTPEAFQLDPLAFQLDEVDEAFQCGGFQIDAFQVASTCVIDTPPSEPPAVGGSFIFVPYRRPVEEDEALLLHLLH